MEKFNPKKFKFHRMMMENSKLWLGYKQRPQTQNNFNPNSYGPDYMNFTNKFWEACQISMQIGN